MVKEIHAKILEKRSQSTGQYTIEGAVADAILYHGACTVNEGIIQAEKSLQTSDDIGVVKLNDTLNKAGFGRYLAVNHELRATGSVISANAILKELSHLYLKLRA